MSPRYCGAKKITSVRRPEAYLAAILAIIAVSGLAIAASHDKAPAPKTAANVTVIDGASPFTDTFSGIDKSRWAISNGWRNGKYMVNDWQKSQVGIEDGLTLTLARGVNEKHPFSSGEVQSKALYGHGYFETTMRAAPGSGVVTGFFTYTGPPFGKPWNEIDVEILGSKPNEILLTYFYHGDKISYTHPVDFDATASFHTYGFNWQPGSIEWYVDGKAVHRAIGDALPLPNEAQKLMVHMWASETLTDWLGPFDMKPMPTSAKFTCIGYAPDAGGDRPCG